MIEKIRNIAIILAVISAAGTYGYTAISARLESRDYHRRLEKARKYCTGPATNYNDREDDYKFCLRTQGIEG
jgi:hypothetical protein